MAEALRVPEPREALNGHYPPAEIDAMATTRFTAHPIEQGGTHLLHWNASDTLGQEQFVFAPCMTSSFWSAALLIAGIFEARRRAWRKAS